MKPPRHGDTRGRINRVVFHNKIRSFQSRNGEGLVELPAREEFPEEQRFCAPCGKWIRIVGLLAFFYADHVGCESCGSVFPSWSKKT